MEDTVTLCRTHKEIGMPEAPLLMIPSRWNHHTERVGVTMSFFAIFA